MLGLILACYDYETSFLSKQTVMEANIDTGISWVVITITLLTIVALFLKELTAQEWHDFRDPIIFYKT